MEELFRKFSVRIALIIGSPYGFLVALGFVLGWAVLGFRFGFSSEWQLVINTSTTILTFLIVFLIQNTQNRDARAIHIKLDELIKAVRGARNSMVDIENTPDDELDKLHEEFAKMHEKTKKERERRMSKKKIS